MEDFYRGSIISKTLEIEDLLKRNIYNYYFPLSEDKQTRVLFLMTFIANQPFGTLKSYFFDILKSKRYNSIYNIATKKSKDKVIFEDFVKELKELLNELNVIRNFVAHGKNITGAFLYLEEGDLMILNNLNLKKINNDFLKDFNNKIDRTKFLLNITNGFVKNN